MASAAATVASHPRPRNRCLRSLPQIGSHSIPIQILMKNGATAMGTVPGPFPTKILTAPSQLEVLQRFNACPGVLHQAFASAVLITNLMGIGVTGAALELILAQPRPSTQTYVAFASTKMSRADLCLVSCLLRRLLSHHLRQFSGILHHKGHYNVIAEQLPLLLNVKRHP